MNAHHREIGTFLNWTYDLDNIQCLIPMSNRSFFILTFTNCNWKEFLDKERSEICNNPSSNEKRHWANQKTIDKWLPIFYSIVWWTWNFIEKLFSLNINKSWMIRHSVVTDHGNGSRYLLQSVLSQWNGKIYLKTLPYKIYVSYLWLIAKQFVYVR